MEFKIEIIKTAVMSQYQQLSPYMPAMFFSGGFVFDVATLGRIDNIFNILSHGVFLFLTLLLLIMQILEIKPKEDAGKIVKLFFKYQNDGVHFLLGALLNAFVIFYFKSSSFINTFMLLVVLFGLLVINEIEYFKQKGPFLKVILFTISLCSFFIYLIPVLLGKIGTVIFISSLYCTLAVIIGVWYYLFKRDVNLSHLNAFFLTPAVMVIVIFTILYAGRVIPPVPVSLKKIGIYHNVEKKDGNYILTQLTPSWKFWSRGDQNFKAEKGDRIYLFASIFSPGGFQGKLYFHFQVINPKGEWITTDKIPMIFIGGRDDGFRGYAYKQNYMDGKWRVFVETKGGLEIGRIGFKVKKSSETTERKFYKKEY